MTLKKLNSLWNRFLKGSEYLVLYREFLREYERLDHMTEISENEEELETYYIPHLGVYHPDKSTTKLRAVFNASSQTALENNITVGLLSKTF